MITDYDKKDLEIWINSDDDLNLEYISNVYYDNTY